MPSPPKLAVTAALVTALSVSLGVVFSPGSDGSNPLVGEGEAADIVQAAMMSSPRTSEVRPAVDTAPPAWEVARTVTLVAKTSRPKTATAHQKKHRQKAPVPPVQFVISTFNVLGSSHTTGQGGMASGPTRIRQTANLLAHHGVDVVGLQELQGDQYRELQRVAGGTYDFWPGTAAGPLGIENSLGWRASQWTAVQRHTVSIPYFDGNRRPMPYVLLRHNASGRHAWFANFHNPATNPKRGNNDRWRAMAMNTEIDLVNRLHDDTGYPVFVTGDMNEREQYFCAMTGRAPMVAANGGSNAGSCNPPSYPMPVDWIFGSDLATFSNYYRDESRYVRSTSDHPMVLARATLDAGDGVSSGD
jgi:endonuclease/exonuclease/phosphatase family metal-dependent hydrolase